MKRFRQVKQWCMEMKVYLIAMTCLGGMYINQGMAYAEESALEAGAMNTKIQKITTYVSTVGLGLSALAVTVVGVMCSIGGQKGRSMAKDHAFGIVIGIACCACGGGIAAAVHGFFK